MKKHRFHVLMLDLDGTLLEIDMRSFINSFVAAMASFFAPLINPEIFSGHLLASTRKMIQNRDRNLSNEEVFFQDISGRLKISRPEIQSQLDHFYKDEYPKLRHWASPHPHASVLVETAQAKGMELVLATNPVFPLTGIRQRLEWAGIYADLFSLVTTYENMHFCKPHPEYYLEILEKIKKEPARCLMAGNDPVEDLVAGSAGIATFLVDDHIIVRPGHIPECDFRGSLKDLVSFIDDL